MSESIQITAPSVMINDSILVVTKSRIEALAKQRFDGREFPNSECLLEELQARLEACLDDFIVEGIEGIFDYIDNT